jgi:ABC-type lipoprotein release transport system permease subunit
MPNVWNLLAGSTALMLLLLALTRVPLSYNLRNLTARWRTTLMTALAFTMVIALLTVMMAFVNGMNRLTDGSGRPDNVLVMSDGAPDEAISNLYVGDLAQLENLPYVLRRDGRPMGSRETYLIVNQAVETTRSDRPKRRFLQLRGIEHPHQSAFVHSQGLLPGGLWFSEAGVEELPAEAGVPGAVAIQCAIGEGVARELGRDRDADQLAAARNRQRLDVGDTFVLGNRTWIVRGILDSSASTFGSEIWAKRSLVASIFGKDTYTTLVLRCPDAETARQFKTFLTSYKRVAVAAQVETDYYESLSETNKQFSWAIGFVVFVMSVGGVFGVMNTMYAAISQRIKDIGVLRLLGYSRMQILASFLLESLAIAIIGGALGCALGSLADGWSATSVVSSGTASKTVALRLVVDAPTIAVGMVLTVLMGFLGGLFPSLGAMRMRPLEALR